MLKAERRSQQLTTLDDLSRRQTPLHRLDPRAKLLTTLLFVALVVSLDRYELSRLAPYSIYPIFLAAAGGVPPGWLARRIAWIAPFAVALGIANPLLDRAPMLALGPLTLSGGWVSFCSLLGRSVLTVGAALTLVAVTGFDAICQALARLGVPRLFVQQLMLLHRYLFVLADEAARLVRARALRTCHGRGTGLASWGPLVGHLLLRTLDRGERIQRAMSCRGFTGEVRRLGRLEPKAQDLCFVVGWSALLSLLRIYDLPLILGRMMTG